MWQNGWKGKSWFPTLKCDMKINWMKGMDVEKSCKNVPLAFRRDSRFNSHFYFTFRLVLRIMVRMFFLPRVRRIVITQVKIFERIVFWTYVFIFQGKDSSPFLELLTSDVVILKVFSLERIVLMDRLEKGMFVREASVSWTKVDHTLRIRINSSTVLSKWGIFFFSEDLLTLLTGLVGDIQL
jgi:hypothetical protein